MPREYDGIKFFSASDLSVGYYIRKAEQVIISFCDDKQYNINQIIEFYNIQELMEVGAYPRDWTEEKYRQLKEITSRFSRAIDIFFSQINDDNIGSILDEVDIDYSDDFWHLLNRHKVIERIDKNVFVLLLNNDDVISHVLKVKGIVYFFGSEIAQYMLDHPETAHFLIQRFRTENRDIWIPKELAKDKYEELILSYMETDTCRHSDVALLINAKNEPQFPVSDSLRLKARKLYTSIMEKQRDSMITMGYSIRVSFEELNHGDHVHFDHQGDTFSLVYDLAWLKENTDYPTIFNNFRYVFEQIDSHGRSNLVSLENRMPALERAFKAKGTNEFCATYQFGFMAALSRIQVWAYNSLLEQFDIQIEDGFNWCFEQYLPAEFGINGFHYTASSHLAKWNERCRNVACEMDRVLKQYSMYVEEGAIDQELFEISSKPIKDFSLPSMIENKYAYPASKDIEIEMAFLFSDQSTLGYTEKYGSKYNTLFDLVRNEDVNTNDFADYQQIRIQHLISRGSIRVESNGQLKLSRERVYILYDLYQHEVICPFHYGGDLLSEISKLVDSGDIRYESALFTRLEKNYLNYELNQAEYYDGLDLRNKYIHGTYPLDERQQESDYYELIKLMILIAWKINEEVTYVSEITSFTEEDPK